MAVDRNPWQSEIDLQTRKAEYWEGRAEQAWTWLLATLCFLLGFAVGIPLFGLVLQ